MAHAKTNKIIIASFIFFIFSYISVPGNASKQGTIDVRSSGSVSVSVTIPHKVGLFAKTISDRGNSSEKKICLRIIDTRNLDGLLYYKINGLDGDYTKELILRSYKNIEDMTKPKCLNNEMFTFRVPDKSKQDNILILTLVPE